MIELADGMPADLGEAGELSIRGPMLMDGYLNKPEATAEALQGDWMHTGDTAVMNAQGWFFLIDRKKT
jgi:long-subunit acyl-CoA synthetase (AMP-forming)